MVLEEKFGAKETVALANRFWESIGGGTAKKFLECFGKTEDLEQIVNTLLRASRVMGESC